MTPEEKATLLIVQYKNILPRMDYVTLEKTARLCALTAVAEIIAELIELRKPEYTTFVISYENESTMDGYEKLQYWNEVKTHLLNT